MNSPPTDLELMMYFDGELDEPRRTEVERFVGGDRVALGKLGGLGLVGAGVRNEAAGWSSKVSLTDAIMRTVESSSAKSQDTARVVTAATPSVETTGTPIERKRIPTLEAVPSSRMAASSKRAANDNGRSIFALAGLAAAAAVALFVWGRGERTNQTAAEAPSDVAKSTEITAGDPPPQLDPTAVVAQAPTPTATTPTAPVPSDDEPGVAVAAVDFGSKQGAIYYMDGDQKGATTTVVWIADE
ncbi:MAG: hypothetical protein U0271_12710 [Polyangiaceae bacterium]